MRAPDVEIGGTERPYMRRWWLIPRNRYCNLYLHQIMRDDDDRALHDHPWINLSLILSGGYTEITFAWPPQEGVALPPVMARRRCPRRLVLRRATTAHRLVLNRDPEGGAIAAWSLFITGPNRRRWGFWCPEGRWVHWRQFTDGPNGEIVGRGCGV